MDRRRKRPSPEPKKELPDSFLAEPLSLSFDNLRPSSSFLNYSSPVSDLPFVPAVYNVDLCRPCGPYYENCVSFSDHPNELVRSRALPFCDGSSFPYSPNRGLFFMNYQHDMIPFDGRAYDPVMEDDSVCMPVPRPRTGIVADPSYVVRVGNFEVRVVVVDGRALYCANDVVMAIGIKTSVRSSLYKLREKHPDLCRVGVLTKLSGSITGQAMTCYPLRVCSVDCPPGCLYVTCRGLKPIDTILASIGRTDVIGLFIAAEERLQTCPNFTWPTPWWRERIKNAEAQRDSKRALNAANKRDKRDRLLQLADLACNGINQQEAIAV